MGRTSIVDACQGAGISVTGEAQDTDDLRAELIELLISKLEAGEQVYAPSCKELTSASVQPTDRTVTATGFFSDSSGSDDSDMSDFSSDGQSTIEEADDEAEEWREAIAEMDEEEAVRSAP